MQHLLLDIGVPCSLFLLMLISGTELEIRNHGVGKKYRRPLILGIAIQLLLIPLLALVILKIFPPDSRIATGILLLTLCPGGGISNYYTYLAKRDVFLSASITTIGTVFFLLTLPIWLLYLSLFYSFGAGVTTLPVSRVVSSLVFFIIVPLGIGCVLKSTQPLVIFRMKSSAQAFSLFLILLILFLNALYFYEETTSLFSSILSYATTFILGTMCLAWALTANIPTPSRPVLIIESAVRNVAIALILGKTLFTAEMQGVFTSFLIGYFVIEICVMLTYARYIRTKKF